MGPSVSSVLMFLLENQRTRRATWQEGGDVSARRLARNASMLKVGTIGVADSRSWMYWR